MRARRRIGAAGRGARLRYHRTMRYGAILAILAWAGLLTGCGAVGLGSLVAQGLGAAIGGGSDNAPKNAAPFRRIDHAQEQRALDDVTSRAVTHACRAQLPPAEDAVSSETAAAEAETGADGETAPAVRRRCGYQPICLPGHARPVTILVCQTAAAKPLTAG